MEEVVRSMQSVVNSSTSAANFRHFIQGEAKGLVWEMVGSSQELLQQFEQPQLYVAELEKRKTEHRKREFLAVRLALKALLGKEVVVIYNEEGKPFLSDKSFHISISHSKNWIAVLIHPSLEVGIDIECPSPKIEKVYTRFLSELEQQELYKEKDARRLHLAWSAKEALYKIIGREAVDFAKQLRIFPFELRLKGELLAQQLSSLQQYKLFYEQDTAYTLVYCLA
jgi:4'-phosphopantetheinyl transferase